MNAAAWFAASSFHSHRPVTTKPSAPVPHVDTRPRVEYVLPDGTTFAAILDHGEYAQAVISYALAGGRIVNAVRADLASKAGR